MSTGFTLQQLFNSPHTEQFLVPEIQRDYVWGPLQLENLLSSLREGWHNARRPFKLQVSGEAATPALVQAFEEHYLRQRYSHYLGFIYAYHDSAYPGQAFLIDGQQRLLSLYLLLLVRAAHENQQESFRAHYLTSDHLVKLDYRVRAATHQFLQRFVTFVLTASQAPSPPMNMCTAVRGMYWYLRAYDQDPTIASILHNYAYLEAHVQQIPDYEHLQHYVRFWYFDTGNSFRGENLYLSLNSSGLLTSTGENQRAQLLATVEQVCEKQYWGQELERWQDFFWKHRHANPNADNGFNEFFRWLRLLAPAWAPDTFGAAESIRQALLDTQTPRELPANFTLPNAARLHQVLRLVFSVPSSTSSSLGTTLPSKWLAPEGSTTTARLSPRELFRLLPVFAYCFERIKQEPSSEQWQHLPRFIRYFHNVNQLNGVAKANATDLAFLCAEAVLLAQQIGASESGDITELLELSAKRRIPVALLSAEEQLKLALYRQAELDRTSMEKLLWELEDDKNNHGEVAHLFDEETLTNATLPVIRRYHQRFFDLGLTELANQRTLQSLLLLWGDAAVEDKGSYLYEQYNYGNWFRIIRNEGGVFQSFFTDFLTHDMDVQACYHVHKQLFYEHQSVAALLASARFENQLRLLALLFDYFATLWPDQPQLSLWRYGRNIGYFYDHHAEGRDEEVEPEQFLFANRTIRFWNAQDRLSSAAHSRGALLPWVYKLFKRCSDTTYRQFVEARLREAGARP